MTLRLITPPALISADADFFDQVRTHIKTDESAESSDGALVTTYIDAAVSQIDGGRGELGRALLTQTWALDLDRFPSDPIALHVPPVADGGTWQVASVTYFDTDNVSQTLPSTDYLAPAGRGYFQGTGAGWPSTAERPDAVSITVASGSAAVSDLPGNILTAILLMTGDLYMNRETVAAGTQEIPMSMTVRALLARHRYWRA